MASSSASPKYSNDPDQWWQPDAWDDPDWKPEDPLTALGDAFSQIGRGLMAAVEPITEYFKRVADQWAEVNEGHVHVHFDPARQGGRNVILGWMRDELDEASVANFIQGYQKIKPILEVTEGHHTVCQHKPRCKPPGPGAAFNKQATQKRRNTRGSHIK